jgi:electron transport complex protein RnfC
MITKKIELQIEENVFEKVSVSYVPPSVNIVLQQDGILTGKTQLEVDQTVSEGQIIGYTADTLLPIHASIPGKITGIDTISLPNGKRGESIRIELEGTFSYLGKKLSQSDFKNKEKNEIINNCKSFGIINTVFSKAESLYSQIMAVKDSNKLVSLRLCGEDPSCFTDELIAKFYTSEVLRGGALAASVIDASGIAIFYNPKNFVLPTESELSEIFGTLPYVFIPVSCLKYPIANKREVITILNKQRGTLPEVFTNDIGLFLDSLTAWHLFECISLSKPVLETFVQVSGTYIHDQKFFKVKIGTPISQLLLECGGLSKYPNKIIVNGLVKGTAISDIDIPITKYVKSIHVYPKKKLPDQRVEDCIHCGNCRSVCPSNLAPDLLFAHYQNNTEIDSAVLNTVSKCEGCGLCNLTCPSRIPLSEIVKLLQDEKNDIRI